MISCSRRKESEWREGCFRSSTAYQNIRICEEQIVSVLILTSSRAMKVCRVKRGPIVATENVSLKGFVILQVECHIGIAYVRVTVHQPSNTLM